jgi:protein-disulfide isomerase
MTDVPGHDLQAPVTTTDHLRGALDRRVTVVEFGDFECPGCRATEPAVQMLLQERGAEVGLVFRHFPLEAAHPNALLAAEASEAAGAQGKFWEMHDALLAPGQQLGRRALDALAVGLGLDGARFKAALDGEIYRQRVREQMAGAKRSHLRAAPGFYVNGRVCDISGGMQALLDAVDIQLGTVSRAAAAPPSRERRAGLR